MEPKDLKNSEELESTAKSDLNNSDKKDDAKKENPADLKDLAAEKETVVSKPETKKKEKTKPEKELASEEGENATETNSVEETKEPETEQEVNTTEPELKEEVEEPVKQEEATEKTEEPVAKDEEKKAEEVEEQQAEIVESSEEKASDEASEQGKTESENNVESSLPETKPAEKVKKKEETDYTKYTQIELVNALRGVLDNPDDFYDVKAEVDIIKSTFYKLRNENIEAAKKVFIDEGGMEEEFVAEEDPYENDIKDLLKKFRQIRIELSKKLDVEKEENLKRKYEVIENIKNLINNEESINKTFNEFRDLQREWHEIGLVPQSKMKNLWDLYHFHVENFYDYIKINRELRDLDLKKNLEMKIALCENAEELLLEPSIIKAFNTLQKYHEQWREIGPVPRENKDDIWERFKSVTAKINKKHQEFFESRKTEQKKNLEAKTALCEKVEEICESEFDSYKDWDEKSKELVELQKVWRTIGFAPKKDNNKIYERFRTACDNFFNQKREFYSKNKELQQNNLQMKIDLCVLAESLKDSMDWKKTTQEFINIQKQWKEIGPIPRKQSDIVWKRFRAACDYFFDKKSEHFSDVDSEQIDNLKLKEELIAEVEKFKSKGNVDENLKALKEFQRRWTEIGHVPFKKKDKLQNQFREAINKLYDELNIDNEQRNMLKFKSKMSSYSESNRGQNKMRFERDKYMNKLKQLENDLVLLDNNIGFFAKSKNAESLIKDVKKKIEDTKQKIEMLKEKIRVIDEMDNE